MPNKHTQTELAIKAFTGLLTAFRSGRIGNPSQERPLLERYLSALSTQWDERYPGFPKTPARHASFVGVARRGIRDEYLS